MFEVVLGIESSGDRGSVALSRNGSLVAEKSTVQPNRHAESLLPLIEQLLAETGHDKRQIDAICVGTGPGSFTGLRVGIALATGMALGLNVPVLGVDSLTVLAAALLRRVGTPEAGAAAVPLALVAISDARRGESFLAAYDEDLDCLLPPRLIANAEVEPFIRSQLARHRVMVAGAAAQTLVAQSLMAEALLAPNPGRDEAVLYPSAHELTLLASSHLVRPDPLPFYLRDADAKLPVLPQNPLSAVD